MVLRAGSEFPLNTGPWEEAWQKAASSDRMGWGVEWAHLRHPSRCKPHSCISAKCSTGKRNTHTHTKELSLPSSEKMTVQIFMKYLGGLSQPCMDTCKLLPSWIGKCVFPLEFPSKWAIPATLSMRSWQKWTGSMLADTGLYAQTVGPGSPSEFLSPIQCFIHLLTQCKPDCKCCPSPSACCSLHGEGIQAYKPRRHLLAIVAQG